MARRNHNSIVTRALKATADGDRNNNRVAETTIAVTNAKKLARRPVASKLIIRGSSQKTAIRSRVRVKIRIKISSSRSKARMDKLMMATVSKSGLAVAAVVVIAVVVVTQAIKPNRRKKISSKMPAAKCRITNRLIIRRHLISLASSSRNQTASLRSSGLSTAYLKNNNLRQVSQ